MTPTLITKPGPNRPAPGLPSIFTATAILLVCGFVLSPVLTAGFLSRDDGMYLKQAARLRGLGWTAISTAFRIFSVPSETGGYYQPLALLSLAVDARLTRDLSAPAFQFHLTQLTLHLVNTLLVFILLQSLARGLMWPALLTLLFALHPAQVEPVAWISQRGTVLGLFFVLLALNAYLRGTPRARGAGPTDSGTTLPGDGPVRGDTRPLTLFVVTICYAAAVLSKPTYLALPIVFLILDLWPDVRAGWRPFVEKTPLFVVLLAALFVQAAIHRRIVARPGGSAESMVLLGRNLAGFVRRLVLPADLSPFYPMLNDRLTVAEAVTAVGVPVGLIVLGVWSFRRSRPLFVALCGMLCLILPALLDMAYSEQLLGDAYLYAALIVPLAASAVAISGRGHMLAAARGRISAAIAAAVAIVFAVTSYGGTFTWQSSQSLYREAMAKYPTWPRGYTGLVEAYLEENELDSALFHAERAARVAPEDPTTQFYLGTTLLLHHGSRSADAIAPLRKALRSNPNWIACLQNLGVALARAGQYDRAIACLEKARDLEPNSAEIRTGLGHAYLKVHRPASARRELQEALKRANDPIIHLGLAMAWAANDAVVPARRHLKAALAKDPRMAARAASSPELRRLHDELDDLFQDMPPGEYDAEPLGEELPAARSARGS